MFTYSFSPSKNVKFNKKHDSTKFAPTSFTNLAAAFAVPPVAIKSSINKTLAFFLANASKCISTSSKPYSNSYFSHTVVPGNLPFSYWNKTYIKSIC